MNPYLPIWRPISREQAIVMRPELSRQASRAKHWEKGRQDRLSGQPCLSANGAYLEGWHSK